MLRIERSHDSSGSPATIAIHLDSDAGPWTAVTALHTLPVSSWERESIRWYLEDFREFPSEPAPSIAAATAERIEQLGNTLFRAVFATPELAAIWSAAREDLTGLDWEIDADLADEIAIPFEMMRDPDTGIRPALVARSFTQTVRGSGSSAPVTLAGPLRILLVVARPHADLDVPFRSIASRLIRHATGGEGGGPRIDVLRPPSFAALTRHLRQAAQAGEPYQIVHFDGHGLFGAVDGEPEGYAVFEEPGASDNQRLVSGSQLGAALVEGGVQALVLNACRSGRSESTGTDVYASLARKCVDAGVTAVVAMRYDIYVATAGAFVETLYDLLFEGHSLPHAVCVARAGLAADTVHGEWLVPVILQSSTVFVQSGSAGGATVTPVNRPGPSETFVGRDDLTITIDRTFDADDAILLWGAAGVGKSALARDFAAWYRASRGADGITRQWRLDTAPQAVLDDIAAHAVQPGPAIWIWDAVEHAASWSEDHRRSLLDALERLRGSGIKVVLASRDRAAWLPSSVKRLQVRPLSPAEADELAGAEAAWTAAHRELCGGYPDIIRAVVGGLRETASVAELYDGRVAIDPVDAAGRSLASLSAVELDVIRLAAPFRSTLSPYHLSRIRAAAGVPKISYERIAAVLDRVADLGWFTRLPGEHFGLHPYLHHALRQIAGEIERADIAIADIEAAYRRCFADFGHGLFWSFNLGNPSSLHIMALEETELLHAFELALTTGVHHDVFGPLQALRMLYLQSHRDGEWLALVARLAPAMLDPITFDPRADVTFADASGHGLLLDYAGALAQHRRDEPALERIAAARREYAAKLGASDDDGMQPMALRSEVVQLLESGTPDDQRRALDLANRIGDTRLEVSALVDLSHSYRHDGDLVRAQLCLDEALALAPATDTRQYVRILDGLGALMLSRFDELIAENFERIAQQAAEAGYIGRFDVPLTSDQAECLRSAYRYYTAALRQYPSHDVASVASLHHQLGGIAGKLALWSQADTHYRKAIAGHDQAGNVLRAAQSRGDFANHLVHRGQRYAEALSYARTALAALMSLPDVPEKQLRTARSLVEELEQEVAVNPSPGD